jgi:tetratricopeptide (TPR) repeat protein
LRAGLLILPILLAASAYGAEPWVEVETEHFLIRSDGGEAATVVLADELERFRQVIGIITTTRLPAAGGKRDLLRLDAYAKRRDYRRASVIEDSIGFYAEGENGPGAAISLQPYDEKWQPTGMHVLRHEYTHHVLNRYSTVRYPAWYNEGFAEYLSVLEFRGGEVVVGLPVLSRMLTLRNSRDWLDVKQLMEAKSRYLGTIRNPSIFDHGRRNGTLYQYAQGWLITHFLQHSERFRPGVGKYILALNQPGADDATAFTDAFGVSYREFDRLIRDYWYGEGLPYGTMSLRNVAEMPPPRIRVMHPFEARAVANETNARLCLLEGRRIHQAESALADVLEAGVRPLEMRGLLAELAIRRGDWDTAASHLDALLRERPEDPAGLTLKARLLTRGEADEAISAATIQQMREAYRGALRSDPEYVPALVGVAALALLPGQEADDEARTALATALELAPGVYSVREVEVAMLAKADERDEARVLAQHLVSWASSTAEKRRAQELVRMLDKAEAE